VAPREDGGPAVHRTGGERHHDVVGGQPVDQVPAGAGLPVLDAVVRLEQQREVGTDRDRAGEHVPVHHVAVGIRPAEEAVREFDEGRVEVVPDVTRTGRVAQPRQRERVERTGEIDDGTRRWHQPEQGRVEPVEVGQALRGRDVRRQHLPAPGPPVARVAEVGPVRTSPEHRGALGEQVQRGDLVQPGTGPALQVREVGRAGTLPAYHLGDRVRMDAAVLRGRDQPRGDGPDGVAVEGRPASPAARALGAHGADGPR
jgi:hypothetical protein